MPSENVQDELKGILMNIAHKYDYNIKEMEIMPNHIYIFLSVKPTVVPTDVVRTLKSILAIILFKQNPKIKSFYGRCGSLWSKGYFVSTIGNINEETVRKYIQEQKSKS